MQVRVDQFDERSEPDADGSLEWAYVGAHYHFLAGGEALVFRRYNEDRDVATLVAPVGWRPDVYAGPLFRAAVAYLSGEGVRSVHVADPEPGAFAPPADAIAAARRVDLEVGSLADREAAT